MLAPIEWRQVAGYPSAAFCGVHDRLIEPIMLTDAEGILHWGCPYCAEEQMPQVMAKSAKPPVTQMSLVAHGFHNMQPRYWCPERGCNYNTTIRENMGSHAKVIHGAHTKMSEIKCAEGMCDKEAYDFCAQCEVAVCKDHMDWRNMCVTCGSDAMFPNF